MCMNAIEQFAFSPFLEWIQGSHRMLVGGAALTQRCDTVGYDIANENVWHYLGRFFSPEIC